MRIVVVGPGTAGTYNDNPHLAPILFRGIGPQPGKVAAGRPCFSPFWGEVVLGCDAAVAARRCLPLTGRCRDVGEAEGVGPLS